MKKKIALLLTAFIAVQTVCSPAVMATSVSENTSAESNEETVPEAEGKTEAVEEPEATDVADDAPQVDVSEASETPEIENSLSENEVEEEEHGFGYIDLGEYVPDVVGRMSRETRLLCDFDGDASLPSSYRTPASKLPALRNQGNYGTCWAFSAIGACEADMISKGYATNSVNYAESHLAYFFYNKPSYIGDRLNHTIGDFNRLTFGIDYKQQGGNNALTMWHLASWAGPFNETTGLIYDYSKFAELETKACNQSEDMYSNQTCHVQDVYILSPADKKAIKEQIKNNGAIAASYYSDVMYDSAVTVRDKNNSSNILSQGLSMVDEGAYYCYETHDTNHAVQLVGWDDNYPVNRFKVHPSNPGAWLVKNSWGAETSTKSQDGYFWLSYEDKSLSSIYSYICEKADNYDNIYQYDGGASNTNKNPKYFAVPSYQAVNIFAASDPSGCDELVKAVSVGVAGTDVPYTAEVYLYEDNECSYPTSGRCVSRQSGTLQYAGYHTIPLETPVTVSHGQKYGVVFTFPNTTYVYVDESVRFTDEYGRVWMTFYTDESAGQSYYCSSPRNGLKDLATSQGATARIKAFTDVIPDKKVSGVTISKSSATLLPGQTTSVSAKILGTSDNVTCKIKSSNPAVATVTNGTIRAISPGVATIYAVLSNGMRANCVVTVTPVVESVKKAQKTSSGVKITVAKQVGVTGYEIYRSKKKAKNGSRIATIKGKVSYVDKKIKNKPGTYYYRTRAYVLVNGKKIYGAFSQPKKVKIKKANPVS